MDAMRDRLATARSGTLATVTSGGHPHVVPCCFVLAGDTVYTAIDAKPKSTLALKRLDNVRANPAISLLVDHFAEDWSALWWVRVDGTARIVEGGSEREIALDALAAKYPQYVENRPPGPVIAIEIGGWRSWEPGGG